jgi:hypothetical protein
MDLVKDQIPVEIEGESIIIPQEFADEIGISLPSSSHVESHHSHATLSAGISC